MRGDGSVRTIVLFSFIALVLCGLSIGGVWIIKARNRSYATVQQPIVAQPDAVTSTNGTGSQGEQAATDDAGKSTETTPSENPVAQPQGVSDGLAAVDMGPQSMPATGGSSDFVLTSILMMLAAFFCARLWRAKTDIRRVYDAS